MTYFHKDSAFELDRKQRATEPLFLPEDINEKIAEAQESTTKVAAKDAPVEHWHHDLRTVSILLDQEPPDVRRALRLVEEISDEMYREMR